MMADITSILQTNYTVKSSSILQKLREIQMATIFLKG